MKKIEYFIKKMGHLYLFVLLMFSFSFYRIEIHASIDKNTSNSLLKLDSFEHSTWNWSYPKIISDISSDSSNAPSLAVDSLGNLHFIWHDRTDLLSSGTDADIFYRHWNITSLTWSPIEIISSESAYDSLYPSIAIDSMDNVHVVWEDLSDYAGAGLYYDIFYKCWNSSTLGWTTTEVVSTESDLQSHKPSIGVDIADNIHIAWWESGENIIIGNPNNINYKYKEYVSQTWTSVIDLTTGLADSFDPSLAVDSLGNVHIVWWDWTAYGSSGSDYDIFYIQWEAATSSWHTIEVVSTESNSHSYFPSLAIDDIDNIHVVWEDFSDYKNSGADRDIFYKRLDTLDNSWTVTEVVSRDSNLDSYEPSIDIDSSGNIHVVWRDVTNYNLSGPDWDVFYNKVDYTFRSWKSLTVISKESTEDSLNPTIVVDSADNIHIIWQDLTNYKGCGNDWDIFFKRFTSIKSPELASIVPNPTDINTVDLSWNEIAGAKKYYILRSTSYIWSAKDLAIIDIVTSNSYADILPSEGFFYYIVIASSEFINSTISNCQHVQYRLPHVREYVITTSLILSVLIIFLAISRVRKKIKS